MVGLKSPWANRQRTEMTTDEPPASAGLPPEPRQRKAPTIDLTATEIRGSPGQVIEADTAAGGRQPSTDVAQEEKGPTPPPSAEADPPRSTRWHKNPSLWAGIAAGVA